MNDDQIQIAMTIWVASGLPARLDVVTTAKRLGYAEHDIQILRGVGLLTALGDPASNAPKWFAAVDILRVGADAKWLHKATKEVSKYWREKRARRTEPPAVGGSI